MSPDRIDFIHSILNAGDLAIGVTTENAHRPFTFAGGGRKVGVTRDVAEKILSLIEKHWGHDASEAIVLRWLLNPKPHGAEGGAA